MTRLRNRIFGAVLAVGLCLCLAGVVSLSAGEVLSGFCGKGADGLNLAWTLYEDGVLRIEGEGPMANYRADDGEPVSGGEQAGEDEEDGPVLDSFAPWHRRLVRRIELSEGVTSIGRAAFFGCGDLEEVTLPTGVRSIGRKAFKGCRGLALAVIPESVRHVGEEAFFATALYGAAANWTGGTAGSGVLYLAGWLIELGEDFSAGELAARPGTVGVADCAACGCGIARLTLPDGVSSIGFRAFAACPVLVDITIPASVELIRQDAFRKAEGNQPPEREVWYGGDKAQWNALVQGDDPDDPQDPQARMHFWHPEIPARSPYYGVKAHYETEDGTEIHVLDENGVRTPAARSDLRLDPPPYGVCGAEGDGSGLAWELADGGVLTFTGSGPMADYDNNVDGGNGAWPPWYNLRTQITAIAFSDGMTSIGRGAFIGCHALKSLTIPGNIESIGDSAFEQFIGSQQYLRWKSVVIQDGVKTIGNGAFYFNCKIESLSLPDSLTSIGDSAFMFSYALPGVELPASLERLGKNAFQGCTSLTGLAFREGSPKLTSIGDEAFLACSKLARPHIPAGVREVGSRVFDGTAWHGDPASWTDSGALYLDGWLLEVKDETTGDFAVQAGTAHIADFAGCGCDIASLTVPDGVESIGNTAFAHCCLKKAVLADSVTSLGKEVFKDCESLEELTLSRSLEEIPPRAFKWSGLAEVAIPEGVLRIGEESFACCPRLVDVVVPVSVAEIGKDAFRKRVGDYWNPETDAPLRAVWYGGDEGQWQAVRGSKPSAPMHFWRPGRPATETENGVRAHYESEDGREIHVLDENGVRTPAVREDLVLKARCYVVRFDGNGADAGEMSDQVFVPGTAQSLAANGFAREGYVFGSWNTAADGTGEDYADGQSVDLAESGGVVVALHAMWKFELPLAPGWNLVSVPERVADSGSNRRAWAEFRPMAYNAKRRVYQAARLPLAAGTALWLFNPEEEDDKLGLECDSTEEPATGSPGRGWRLVGVKGRSPQSLPADSAECVWRWEDGRWRRLDPVPGTGYELQPGRGYAVRIR